MLDPSPTTKTCHYLCVECLCTLTVFSVATPLHDLSVLRKNTTTQTNSIIMNAHKIIYSDASVVEVAES